MHGIEYICHLGPGEALSQGLALVRMLPVLLLGAGGNEMLVHVGQQTLVQEITSTPTLENVLYCELEAVAERAHPGHELKKGL